MKTNLKYYSEKELLADALEAEQTATILYNLAASNALTPSLHDLLLNLLNDTHNSEFQLLMTLHDKGYRPAPPADKHALKQTRRVFTNPY